MTDNMESFLEELEKLFNEHDNPRISNTKETKCNCVSSLLKTDICVPEHCHIIHEDHFHYFEALFKNKQKILPTRSQLREFPERFVVEKFPDGTKRILYRHSRRKFK